MELTYRLVTEKDLAFFQHLCQKLQKEQAGVSFADIESTDDLSTWIAAPTSHLYGIFDSNKMVGVLKAERGEPGKEHSCYLSAAIEKQYRGQGLSKRLLQYGLIELAKDGIAIARAKVYNTNVASIAMLLSLGFTWSGTIYKHQWDDKSQQYIDDLIFHKELAASR